MLTRSLNMALCAFANDFENLGGGYIVIGQHCDAEGRPATPPVGLAENQIDKIQREITCCVPADTGFMMA